VPELPDLTLYLDALARVARGRRVESLRIESPFVLRSVAPAPGELAGRRIVGERRLGKRIVLELEGEAFVVVHLMIAGRLHWKASPPGGRQRNRLAVLELDEGALVLTEASKKKRASIHLVAGEAALAEHDPGGVEPLEVGAPALRAALERENRTLKRALTDPRLVAGIGNAYSDEILWRAELSPFARTRELGEPEWERLLTAIPATLGEWIARLREATGERFPEKVTAFRPEMAVHGRYGAPCPRCGRAVQRIVYAENEANYCAACQTGGRLLADRALSRLLHDDWPRTLDELEARRAVGPEDG